MISILAAAALAAIVASPGPKDPPNCAARECEAVEFSEATATRIDRFVRSAMEELGLVPGLSLAIVKGDKVVHSAGYGWANIDRREPATPETIFYTASLSKALTGMGAAVLAAEGTLDLDAPITRYLPGAEFSPPLAAAKSSSVRNLLTHTPHFSNSGINFYTTFVGRYDDHDLMRVLSNYSSPSEGFAYSNTNYALVSEILERAGRRPWQDVLASEVFHPVGMRSTTAYASGLPIRNVATAYIRTKAGFEAQPPLKTDYKITGAGGFYSSANDLARYVVTNLNDGRLDGRQALPAAAVREAQKPQADVSARFFEFDRWGYGLGLYNASYDGETLIHHFGGIPGGFSSHMSFMPEHGIGIVVLQNTAMAASFPHVVATYVYDLFLGRTDTEERARRRINELADGAAQRLESNSALTTQMQKAAAANHRPTLTLEAYLGVYENPRLGTVHVCPGVDGFRVQWGEIDAPMVPVGGNDFLVQWQPGYEPATWSFSSSEGQIDGFSWEARSFDKVRGGICRGSAGSSSRSSLTGTAQSN